MCVCVLVWVGGANLCAFVCECGKKAITDNNRKQGEKFFFLFAFSGPGSGCGICACFSNFVHQQQQIDSRNRINYAWENVDE